MKLTTVIIDDEVPARELLREFLKDDHEVDLLGAFQNGFEGLKAINEFRPDLVILDIQMPKITGFEMLELLEHHPIIIFSTAYNEFAIRAFELNAVDYLLKPYSRERFLESIQKAKDKKMALSSENTKLQNLMKHVDEHRLEYLERIVVKTGSKIHVITIDHIRYLESQDDYVMIHTGKGRYLKQKTMKFYEERLDPKHFVRIHRSYIVKISEIDRLELMEKESYVLWLKDKTKLKVSKTGYPKLKQALNF